MDPQALYQKHIALGATPEQAAAVVKAVMDAQTPANFIRQGYGGEGGEFGVDQGAEDRAAAQFPYYARVIAEGRNSVWSQMRPLVNVLGAAALGGYAAGGSGGAGAGAGAGGAGAGEAAGAAASSGGASAGIGSGGGASAGSVGSAGAAGAGSGGGASVAGASGAAAVSPWQTVATSLAGPVLNSVAARGATKAQQQATQAALTEQGRQYDQTRTDFQPYREAGYRALGTLEGEINRQPTAEEVMAQPGYQFGLSQGQLGMDRKASAMGGRVSGEALKRAAMFATDYATTGYNAEYQRRQDRLNRLATLANVGQTATGTGAGMGQQSSNAISNLLTSQGDATAAGRIAQGNIWGNALNQGAAAYNRQGGFGGYGSSSGGYGSSGNYGGAVDNTYDTFGGFGG